MLLKNTVGKEFLKNGLIPLMRCVLTKILNNHKLTERLTKTAFADLTDKYTWSRRAKTLLASAKSGLG